MADANYVKFDKRLREIERRHRKAAAGYVRLVERDGLLVPVDRVRVRRGFPLRGLALTLAAFLVFKGFVLADLGLIAYQNRIGALADGNPIEKIGAWIMHSDPITIWIASQFSHFL